MSNSISISTSFTVLLLVGLSCCSFTPTEAYDALDPTANITIRWDIIAWIPDGYVALVTINNLQRYRHIQAPGWSLGWTWEKKEVIWEMVGGEATRKGNCSRFNAYVTSPHSCQKTPSVVDLLPSAPYNMQIGNCCKGGILSSLEQDPANAVAAFQLSVGESGTNNRTVRLPKNFTLTAPGPGAYTCGRARIVKPTQFFTGKRVTQSFMTWNVTCTYSLFLAQKVPTCCVSLSSFYNNTSVPCNTCSCGCKTNTSKCVEPHSSSIVPNLNKSYAPIVQCTSHMCPIQINWQVTENLKKYWLVKLKITNFSYRMNYSDWNLVIQHPNFDNSTQIFRFNYKTLTPYAGKNDIAMLWGLKFYNSILMQAGPLGTVEGELLFEKHGTNSNSSNGWAFPRRVYFNGENCNMPSPDLYPVLPN